ncbi:cobalamin B12-binding domain-containing protein [Tautonia plasticadhaerens]|uniref:B12 binding domain protein n=1 Tax=Tautonia plasticadhaerens TaxID=2527974 RepID=A0A518GYC1_9BACT|nr:cobalamin-dependent protein [Tautonia plasticadhaerens]QDV33585.1 B12 binding domain protein [Tautonia plasticadhaerens]
MSPVEAQPPLHLSYFDRLLQLDRHGAIKLVERFLLDREGDVAALYAEVLVPALVHTGQQWQEDRISVAHEHYISEVTRDLILRHGPRLWASPEAVHSTAVACCAPNERHVLGLLMAADILRAAGLDVHLLGEGAPPESVGDFVAEVDADVLALSVSLPEHVDDASALIEGARARRPSLLVVAGGRGLAELPDPAARVGADYVTNDLRDLHRELPRLLKRPSPGSSRRDRPPQPS